MNNRPKRNTPAGEAPQRATSGQNVPKSGERANAGTRRHCRGPRKSHGFVRGGAAERVSFRTCAEAKDAQLARRGRNGGKSMTTEEKKLLQAKHRLEEARHGTG